MHLASVQLMKADGGSSESEEHDGRTAEVLIMAPVGRVGVVVGTRPDAIRLAPLIDAARGCHQFDVVVIGSGQHRQLLRQHLAELRLELDHELEPASVHESLLQVTARIMTQLSQLLPSVGLRAMLVHGDTTTCVAAALSAFYSGVPVVHVEAGLRSRSRLQPYPEEVNRRITTLLADLHLAPTATARDNLLTEGVLDESIKVTGNTLVDSITTQATVRDFADPRLTRLLARPARVVLMTMHRRESWGLHMSDAVAAITTTAPRWSEVPFVVPAHPNPRIQVALRPLRKVANAIVTAPMPRREFLGVLAASEIVLTDSGGVQEEAPSYGAPVLVLRDNTERHEGIDAGAARLVGTDPAVISNALEDYLSRPRSTYGGCLRPNPYGDGAASQRCVVALRALLAARWPEDTGPLLLGEDNNLSTRAGATTC